MLSPKTQARIETGYDETLKHWWYRLQGRPISDCGYGSQRDAMDCGIARLEREMEENGR